ncbi:glycine-rich protein [Melia azedarach]|uniref:Glycine-rich protein n=1 Tax=Melia azedarach TaxID=155640 RepID=A0ACC1XQY9_MELAZ|nr:glycine-rich protein [Melia azedarach]
MNGNGRADGDERGLIWKLPEVKLKDLGRMGPAFGAGIGCGVGVGVGVVGGVGIGPGFPGLQFGAGFGAGCGIGVGFGYGLGKGVAHDEHQRYSNIGRLFQGQRDLLSQDMFVEFVDELVLNTKKLLRATSREIEKRRR